MLKVYIPQDVVLPVNDRQLFVMARPFRSEGCWQVNESVFARWGLNKDFVTLEKEPENAHLMIIPYDVRHYKKFNQVGVLNSYQVICKINNYAGYAFIGGDMGLAFPEFSNIFYFRSGGFKHQLSANNLGFPTMLSDQLSKIYQLDSLVLRTWRSKPVIGFCGHATKSTTKLMAETLKYIIENFKRALLNPFRRDWEPIFPSAYQRARVLRQIERSNLVVTNFIFRNHYRAGAITEEDRQITTKEYYDNILNSDYVVCLRGGGNFSVRLYETLMMGRIPIVINTNCLLPFEAQINWRDHVVWVEWSERHLVSQKVLEFHNSLKEEKFERIQSHNRHLWKDKLSVSGIYNILAQLSL